MAVREIEARIASLEAEMARVKEQLNESIDSRPDWLDTAFGSFDNDPIYREAMKLGRKYRESLRPIIAKNKSNKPKKNAVKTHKR